MDFNNNDNAKRQLQWTSTIYNCSRTTPLMSSTICQQLCLDFQTKQLKDNSFNKLNIMPLTLSGLCNKTAQGQLLNELKNNNDAKGNSLDLYTISQRQFNGLLKNLTQLTIICCTQVFCDSIPNVGVRKDPKFLPFPHFLLATYT